MRLGIFTTLTDPIRRGDNWEDALDCYADLSDQLVVINGKDNIVEVENKINSLLGFNKNLYREWPKEFSWELIGNAFQYGYESLDTDWCIHADTDFLFHENDFEAIREACANYNDQPAFSMLKRQFILPDRFNLKSRLVVAVNKGKFGDRIRFDSGKDLCQPSLDSKYIEPGTVPDVKIPIWNYDFLTKTKEQVTDDVGRMDRAYMRHFGKWLYSDDGSEESAYQGWLKMVVGRSKRHQEHIPIESHSQYIQETIKNLQSDQCGHSIFGNIEPCNYYRKDA